MHMIVHRGCTDTVRESVPKADCGETKIPCSTGESNLRQRRAGPMLYQLSYIPNPAGLLYIYQNILQAVAQRLANIDDDIDCECLACARFPVETE